METDFEVVQLELKYCERCGGLWLRPLGGADVYCPGCAPAMSEMAIPLRRKSRARLPINGPVEIKGESGEWTGVHDPGGAA